MANVALKGLNARMQNFLLGCVTLLLVAGILMLWRQAGFRQFYEANPLPLFRLDGSLRLVLCNRAFAQLLGYSSSRECQALFAEYTHGLAVPGADAQTALARAAPFDGSLRAWIRLETRYGENIGEGVELFQRLGSGRVDLCLQAGSGEQAAAFEFEGFLSQQLVPAFVLRPNLQVQAANSLAAREFGAGVVLGRLESLLPRGDRARVSSLIERRLGSNSSASLRFPALLQNAEIRECEWYFLRSSVASGELLVLCLVAPAALPIQAMVDQVLARPWGHWTLDLAQQTLALSECWWRFLGYAVPPPPQRLALWRELIAPQDQKRVVQELADYMQGRRQEFAINHRVAGADGVEHQVRTTAVAMTRAENGTVLRIVGLNVLLPAPESGPVRQPACAEAGVVSAGHLLGHQLVHDLLNYNAVIVGHGALLAQAAEAGDELQGALQTSSQAASQTSSQSSIAAIQAAAAGISRLLVNDAAVPLGVLLHNLNKELGTAISWSEAASLARVPDLQVDGARFRSLLEPLLRFCLSSQSPCPGKLDLTNLPMAAHDCCSVCSASLAPSQAASQATSQATSQAMPALPWQLHLVMPALDLDRVALGYLFAPQFAMDAIGRDNPLSALSQQLHGEGGHLLVENGAVSLRLTLCWPEGGLPLTAPPLPVPVPTQGVLGGGGTAVPAHITVVDDQPAVSAYLEIILRQAGYSVRVFNDPRQALQLLRSPAFLTDLLITDQNMPALTGNAIIQAMRQVRPALPIIVCSGYSAQAPVFMTPGGALTVLQKPFEPADLLASIRQLLGQALPV